MDDALLDRLASDLKPGQGYCTLDAADLPGVNDVSPAGHHDDPVFAEHEVKFWGQPVFAVIAETRDQARRAAAQAHSTCWRSA